MINYIIFLKLIIILIIGWFIFLLFRIFINFKLLFFGIFLFYGTFDQIYKLVRRQYNNKIVLYTDLVDDSYFQLDDINDNDQMIIEDVTDIVDEIGEKKYLDLILNYEKDLFEEEKKYLKIQSRSMQNEKKIMHEKQQTIEKTKNEDGDNVDSILKQIQNKSEDDT